jgi:hypothetical protein
MATCQAVSAVLPQTVHKSYFSCAHIFRGRKNIQVKPEPPTYKRKFLFHQA